MRIPFFSMFMTSPFEGLQEHAEKVKECAWAFQQAMECHFSPRCHTFEDFRKESLGGLAALPFVFIVLLVAVSLLKALKSEEV